MILKKQKNINTQSGFTLMEMLVVMVIIGILIILAASNYLSARIKSRDGAKKSDLNQVAEALEMYYNDKGTYPATSGDGEPVGVRTAPNPDETFAWGDVFHDPDNSSTIYMNELPVGPGSAERYFYLSCNDATHCNMGSHCTDDSCNAYMLFARLENLNDPHVATAAGSPADYGHDCGGQECNYVVTSSNLSKPAPTP